MPNPLPPAYNDAVPIEFTRARLVQARAYDKDVGAILEAAGFPFDPLRQEPRMQPPGI